MSTDVTPESLRAHADWMDEHNGVAEACSLRSRADDLEREQRPLPTEPGWHPNIVVERRGESCTGALLRADGAWVTARPLYGCCYGFHANIETSFTIRWAERDGKTPGQVAWEAQGSKVATWICASPTAQAEWESIAAAVLAAHGTSLTDSERAEEYGPRP